MTGFNFEAMLSQNNQIKQIPVDMLVPYHNHQYSLYDGERRDDMVESIRKNGVISPIVCRPNPDGTDTYEILIGHNRWNCSKLAGLDTIPAIIKEKLTEEEAQTYVDESNLLQRGFNDLKISEQARIIARRYSEMFSQGKRNDIINEIRALNGESDSKGNSREKVAEEYGLSRNTIARLVRISKLTDCILQWLDLGELSIRAGVELSYLTECEQDILWQINTVDNSGHMLMKISESQARDLRVLSADCKKESLELSGNQMLKVLAIKKKKPDKKIAINPNTYKKYFTDKSNDEIQQIVEQALEMYYNDRKDA
ncbi:ParB/RepB/Spo0J family partition protein [uncultured Ruminococcus sp.]|jgi:ParB family chromosome partitioning protein|uniref:ParB/RepB/Spo0J family partition protein n=1 Tax=uncultured Ruminococcus sp. TaxID=165186 RepID=UPI0026661CBA|nr:ParB/RepB/Spo0J family partition protein [uncultured Ruminococcus sp.]